MVAEFLKGKPLGSGKDYEVKLHTLFALGGFQHFHDDWKLSGENQESGKFDDLVFETDTYDILLQAKFRENNKIQESQFLSGNPKKDDFSLAKYILSYKTLKRYNPRFLILCTNGDFETHLFDQKPPDNFDEVYRIFEKCRIYTINNNYIDKISDKITEYQTKLDDKPEWKNQVIEKEDIEDFSSKFLCIRAKDGDIETIIRKKLTSFEKIVEFSISSYKYVLDQVNEWYRVKSSNAFYMTNHLVRAILYGETNKQSIDSILGPNPLFNDYYSLEPKNLFQVIPGVKYQLYLKKIIEGIYMSYKKVGKPKDMFHNETLLLNTEDNHFCIDIVYCFTVIKFKFLVIVALRPSEELFRALNTIQAKLDKNKKIIILSDKIHHQDDAYVLLEDKITFDSFLSEIRNHFLNKQISFQGAPFNLEQCKNIDFNNLLDESTIYKLLKDENLSVGQKLKGLGSMKDYYITRKLKKINESFGENDIFERCKEPILVISDQPGTGKSTLLVKIANNWKERFPDHWVIQLDLGLTIKFLENHEDSKFLELLDLYERNNNYLYNNFDKQLMRLLKKIIILDGVDEISTADRNMILSLVMKMSSSYDIVKIIITTRSYSFILEELKPLCNLELITLDEFSKNDQVEFFEKYFRNKKIEARNSEAFINSCPTVLKHFLNIPLYIEMIADIFEEQIVTKTRKSNLIRSISNTYKLFQLFIEKKKQSFISHKGGGKNDSVLNDILNDAFERYLEDLQLLATRNIFDTRPVLDLLDVQPHKSIRKAVSHVGVLEDVKFHESFEYFDGVKFIHKTFEEYFTAQNIWNQINGRHTKGNLLREIHREIFLSLENQNISHFIDCILEEYEHFQLEDLSKKFRDIVKPIENTEHRGILCLSSQGSVNILRLLYEYSDDFPTIINRKGKYGESALLLSAHHIPTVAYLVSRGADIYSKDDNGFTALHYATTRFSSFENFELQLSALNKSLLYKGMMFHMQSVHKNLYKYNEIDHYIKNPDVHHNGLVLQRHANDFRDIFDFFENKDFYLNARTRIGSTILHYLAYCGLPREFKYLVMSGADYTLRDSYGNNVMHYAVLGASLEIVDFLYNLEINLNSHNSNGVAPIHFTPIGNSLEILRFLVTGGVEIGTEDRYGRTVLFYSNSATSLDLVKLIVELGIQTDKKSKDSKYTALHMASYTNSFEIVEYLMHDCGLAHSRDDLGQYPAHYAAEGDAVKVLRYFQESLFPITEYVDGAGASVLHLAAVGDSMNALRYLVEELEMNSAFQDFSGKNPAHYAAANGSLKVLKYLIGQGIGANLRDDKGNTILHYAARNGSINMLRYILEETDATIDEVNDTGKHAIHFAAEKDFLDSIKFFMDRGVSPYIKDSSGNTILHFSALGNAETVTRYIHKRFPYLNTKNADGLLPIHQAIEHDSSQTVKYLIRNGIDVNTTFHNNVTLLHFAARKNSINSIRYLMDECSFNFKTDKNGRSPIHYAAEGDALEVIRYFSEKGINMNGLDNNHCTVVHCAAAMNSMDVLDYCIQALRMDSNKPDKHGMVPLHHAAANNQKAAIEYLVNINQNIWMQDHRNLTVLHWAAARNAVKAFQYFMRDCHSTDISTKDCLGRQPIHIAIEYDSLEIVRYIFNYRIDIDVVDKDGNTLLHCAVRYDSIRVIEYFMEECEMDNFKRRRNKLDLTPLDLAVKLNSVKALEYFGLTRSDNKCSLF